METFTLSSSCSHARARPCVVHSLIKTTISCPPPPPPALLPPLAHCHGRSTIVHSVPSRASADTPKAKATEHGESAGQRPSERDTGSILVWDAASAWAGSARPWGIRMVIPQPGAGGTFPYEDTPWSGPTALKRRNRDGTFFWRNCCSSCCGPSISPMLVSLFFHSLPHI